MARPGWITYVLNTSNCMTLSWSWNTWATQECATLCSRMMPSVSLWSHLLLMLGCSFEAYYNTSLHWLCHYVIWSPEAWALQCPCGLVRIGTAPGIPPVSCTDPVNCPVLQKSLTVCSWSQMHSWTIYTATDGYQMYMTQTYYGTLFSLSDIKG